MNLNLSFNLSPDLEIIPLPPVYQPLTDEVGREIKFETIDYSYKWVIANYSLAAEMVGTKISSSVFPDQDRDGQNFAWSLDLYPRGISETFQDYASLNIVCRNPYKKQIQAVCRFYIINWRGEETNELKYVLRYDETGEYSIGSFIEKKKLEKERDLLLPRNVLTIRCKIRVFLRTDEDPNTVKDRGSTLSEDIKRLYLNRQHTDYTLISGPNQYQVHKNILSTRSTYFNVMFEGHADTIGENTAEITDVSPEVFTELLRYIYTDEAQNLKTLALDLLKASDMYGVVGCKTMCEQVVAKEIKVDNALNLLILAHRYTADHLREECLRFIFNNSRDIVSQPNYQAVRQRYHRPLNHVFARLETWPFQ